MTIRMNKEMTEQETNKFEDAQALSKKYDSFDAPTESELKKIKTNTHVKVCTGAERFWVKVTKANGDTITGKVDNFLMSDMHNIDYGDEITFKKLNVYAIGNKDNWSISNQIKE